MVSHKKILKPLISNGYITTILLVIVAIVTYKFLCYLTYYIAFSSIQEDIIKKGKDMMANEFSVLIVDDDAIIRRIHKVLLSKYGFKISVVEDGQKAVDLFCSGECYDLVFMDMEMPIKDGPQATRELREMGVDSLIIGVTSRGQDYEKQAFMRAGLNDCYVKPLTTRVVDCLLQKLKNNN